MAYSGVEVKIQYGELGLLTDISSDKIPPNALLSAKSVVFTNGNVQKAPGTLLWNPAPAAADATVSANPLIAIHHWKVNSVTDRFIAVDSTGNIFKGRDRKFTLINSTVASVLTPNCIFTEGGAETAGRDKKLFLFTGGATNPYVLSGDGTAFTTMANPSTDWTAAESYPKCGVVHRNSLWAFAGQISYASNTGDHEDFASASKVDPVYPGEGGEIRGAFVFKSRLFAFKEGGFVYMLNDTNSVDPTDWYWEKTGSNFGLAAPNVCGQ